jgi:UDP-N-acetylmuramyl pentapeptide phosphotransferase/UDP-N-acetylglucosamine-1-phosphate transferase
MKALLSFVGISLIAYLCVAAVRYLAHRHGIIDVPNERSSHSTSVPRGGGIAIVLVTLVGVWVWFAINQPTAARVLVAYSAGAILIAVISWLDDLYSQPSWLRFLIHTLGAGIAIYTLGYLPLIHLLPFNRWLIGTLSVLITFLWVVGLTNAYNFMDGIDGIAGGQALVGGIAWMILGWSSGQPLVTVFGLLLAASATGFLAHNWPPARIFMGDVGSAFLGYTLATLPLILNTQSSGDRRGLGAAFIGMLFVWPFVFDAMFTFVRRFLRGERVFSAHRSHLYQRLVIAGRTHAFVSLLYISWAVISAALALGWKFGIRNFSWALMILLPLSSFGLWLIVIRREQMVDKKLRSNLTTFADPV